jgi:hypothetical protein
VTSAAVVKILLYGFIVAEQLFLAVCFYRFWRSTREAIFALFTAGFLVMAIHRTMLAFTVTGELGLEQQTSVYLWRLLAYLLILAGVVTKNLQRRSRTRT